MLKDDLAKKYPDLVRANTADNPQSFYSCSNALHKLYDELGDDESKMIFLKRLNYSFDLNPVHIVEMIESLAHIHKKKNQKEFKHSLFDFLTRENVKSNPIVLYGAGAGGAETYKLLMQLNYKIAYYIDSDDSKDGKEMYGLPVYSFSRIQGENALWYADKNVIISTMYYEKEVYDHLVSNEVPSEKIFFSSPPGIQYFPCDIIEPGNNELFVDGGSYNGHTFTDFIAWCDGRYRGIYAFEPNEENYIMTNQYVKDNDYQHVKTIKKGLWSGDGILRFSVFRDVSCIVSEETVNDDSDTGIKDARKDSLPQSKYKKNQSSALDKLADNEISISVTSIDEAVNDDPITFIKMDVEGSELEALKGAVNTITTYRPQLAICVYHKPEDIIEIPLFLKQLVPEYRFYFRHHSPFEFETVLYATL